MINILILLLFCGCQIGNDEKAKAKQIEISIDTIELDNQVEIPVEFDLETHLENYQRLKLNISKYQNEIRNNDDIDQESKIELAENYMSNILVDSIFQYWLETKWDFNGHTEKPRDGEIACGYFVSTTLRDIGINLNRYKTAQKGATDIILQLCDEESIEKLSSIDELVEFLENVNENEILIVGLDFHVGFLFKKNDENYFAHSNYIDRKGVEIELIQNSIALRNSNLYVVGNLTRNKSITKAWVN